MQALTDPDQHGSDSRIQPGSQVFIQSFGGQINLYGDLNMTTTIGFRPEAEKTTVKRNTSTKDLLQSQASQTSRIGRRYSNMTMRGSVNQELSNTFQDENPSVMDAMPADSVPTVGANTAAFI